MVSSTKPPIVQATQSNINDLARLIRHSFADVATRFGLTPENCPKHPSNCTPGWVAADLQRGVRYYILMADNTPVGCVGAEKASPTTHNGLSKNDGGKAERKSRIRLPLMSDNAAQNRYLEVYMERLAVLPDWRGMGYGTRLVQRAMDQAREWGASAVGIGIISTDTCLKRFYKSLGFKEGETRTFPHLPFEVALMRCRI